MAILTLLLAAQPITAADAPQPDLVVRTAGASGVSWQAGDDVDLWAYVENAGGATASGFSIQLALDGVTIATHAVSSSMPGGSNLTVLAKAWNVSAGAHTVAVTVDSADEVPESNETNVYAFTFHVVAAGPDLRAKVMKISSPWYDGMRGSATVEAENVGTAPASGNVTVETLVDGALAQRRTLPFPPTGRFALNVELPALPRGWHELAFRVDTEGNVSDVDLGNNVVTKAFEVLPTSNLVSRIVSLSPVEVLPGVEHPAGRFNATVEVCNVGVAATLNASVSYSVIGATAGSAALGGAALELPPAACHVGSVLFDTPGVVGAFRFQAEANAHNQRNAPDDLAWANASRGTGVVGVVAPGGARPAPNELDQVTNAFGPVVSNILRQLDGVEGPFASGAVDVARGLACPRAALACDAVQGDPGAGALRPCRPEGDASMNLPAWTLWYAVHVYEERGVHSPERPPVLLRPWPVPEAPLPVPDAAPRVCEDRWPLVHAAAAQLDGAIADTL